MGRLHKHDCGSRRRLYLLVCERVLYDRPGFSPHLENQDCELQAADLPVRTSCRPAMIDLQ
jgi:hypothetical protein